MAEQKTLINQMKEAIEKKKIVIGSSRTIKHLKMKKLKLVVLSTNCPDNVKKDIEHYAGLAGISIETFDGTSKQLGIICGKPFPIVALSIM